MEKVLLHACCATCAAWSIEKLNELGYEPVLYFYNPNIFPPEEFMKRYNELKKYCEKIGVELLIDKQDSIAWYDYIVGLEEEPEKGKRCVRCFELRMLNSASKALKLGINKFTTTLTISPHKVSSDVFEAGSYAAKQFGVEFLAIDFKKENGFLNTMMIAKNENFYRQSYCGCEYSIYS